jgi:hypothetical protein
MDSFIVRMYRRVTGEADEPAGTVENIASGERSTFSDARQLLLRLLGGEGRRDPSAPSQDSHDSTK